MKRWAELHGNTVWATWATEDDKFVPEGRPPVRYVDITELAATPEIGSKISEDDLGAMVVTPPVKEDPPRSPFILTKFEFISRFRSEEWVSGRNDPDLSYFFDLLMSAAEVDMSLPVVEQGLDVLVAKGLISKERKAEILRRTG